MSPDSESSPAQPTPEVPIVEFTTGDNLPWTGITLLIAVLGLLLFMAIPMGDPSPQELLASQREHRASQALETLQRSVEDFHNDHGQWPGMSPQSASSLGPIEYDAEWFERQLKMCSNQAGATVPVAQGQFNLGPYLPNGIPSNPLNGRKSIRILREGESFGSILDGLYGWIYDPRTGEIQPHLLPFQSQRQSLGSSTHVGFGRK